MGYESRFRYEFSLNAKFKNIDKLNEEISKLDGIIKDAKIVKYIEKCDSKECYDMEIKYSYGKFTENEKFATLLSKYITKGNVNLIWSGEDDTTELIKVEPNKIITFTNILVPNDILDDVNKYINSHFKTS